MAMLLNLIPAFPGNLYKTGIIPALLIGCLQGKPNITKDKKNR
jgi:hypothetical protein